MADYLRNNDKFKMSIDHTNGISHLFSHRVHRQVNSDVDDVYFTVLEHLGISSDVAVGDMTEKDITRLAALETEIAEQIMDICTRKAKKEGGDRRITRDRRSGGGTGKY